MINKALSVSKKLIGKLMRLPSALIGRLSTYCHIRNYTAVGKTTPSNISLVAISNFLDNVGVKLGDIIFVHSSWEQLNSGMFSASDIIEALLEKIGEEGTLAMPAIPNIPQISGAKFNVRRTPSAAGILTEVFRRYPGVERSINLNHSVCAIGPMAKYLTKDHHLSETSWDEASPYYRIGKFDNAWVLGLGVGHRLQVATSLHCVESALWKENEYFSKLFGKKICYEYKNKFGEVGHHCYRQRSGQIYTPKLAKYFSKDELIEDTVDGLEVYAIKAKVLIDRSVELGRQGKTMYVWPIPFLSYFKK